MVKREKQRFPTISKVLLSRIMSEDLEFGSESTAIEF